MSWNAGRRGFRQVDESRWVGRAWEKLLLYYTLGSDPALWPAGERRERGLVTHDKGYYHSYCQQVLMTNYPRPFSQALVPLPKTPARATALPAIVRREGILLNPALSVQGGRHAIP